MTVITPSSNRLHDHDAIQQHRAQLLYRNSYLLRRVAIKDKSDALHQKLDDYRRQGITGKRPDRITRKLQKLKIDLQLLKDENRNRKAELRAARCK